MGLLGSGVLSIAGGAAGQKLGQKYGLGSEGKAIGALLGGAAGTLLPFKKGGRVPGKKGAPKKILAHGGEYVLPVGVKPTKAQMVAVAKRHRK